MRDEVVEQLVRINHVFYERFAAAFHHSRIQPAYGFVDLLGWLPSRHYAVLDVGCGNGRFGMFMLEHDRLGRYLGIDYSEGYLGQARRWAAEAGGDSLQFQIGDMMQPGFLDGRGHYDLVACFSALHHVPTRARRVALLQELRNHVVQGGYLLLGTWLFMASERQRKKVLGWQAVGLDAADVEPNDYLISWQRGGEGYRYCALIDKAETASLAAAAGLSIVHQFQADGREGNLNLYSVLV